MLKQSELSAEEQAEAFRRADELFRAESEQAQNAKAAADAAAELGVPQEYLDRAAAQVHAEKVERIKKQRSRRNLGIAIGAGVLLIGAGTTLFSLRSAAVRAPRVAAFTLPLNQTDEATTRSAHASVAASLDKDVYVLQIKEFYPERGNNYQVNVGFPINQSLAGYKRVSFNIEGNSVPHTRVDLRAGNTRWNSPQLNLTQTPQRVSLNLSELQRQTQQGNQWVSARGEGPQNAQSLVFKFGKEINPPDTKGSVIISDVRFE